MERFIQVSPGFSIEYKSVDCDDYGDTHWKYYARAHVNGICVWDDYYHSESDIITTMCESVEIELLEGEQ